MAVETQKLPATRKPPISIFNPDPHRAGQLNGSYCPLYPSHYLKGTNLPGSKTHFSDRTPIVFSYQAENQYADNTERLIGWNGSSVILEIINASNNGLSGKYSATVIKDAYGQFIGFEAKRVVVVKEGESLKEHLGFPINLKLEQILKSPDFKKMVITHK